MNGTELRSIAWYSLRRIRPTYPNSNMIFGDSSLCTLRENSSDLEGLKFGSSSEVSPAFAEVIPLKFGWLRVGDGVGRGAVVPSVPMRKAFVGSTFPAPAQVPSILGPGQ